MTALRKLEVDQPAPATMPDRPTDIVVHLLHRGRVGKGAVNTRLPYNISDWAFFCPAPRMPEADAALDIVREIASRCAPWVKIFVGPSVWSRAGEGQDISAFEKVSTTSDGSIIHELGGIAFSRPYVPEGCPEAILVFANGSARGMSSTLHHEIWHVVEYRIAQGDFDAVDTAVTAARAMPGEYLNSATERRARIYQNWACACDEGWRPVSLFGTPVSRVDRVFLSVYQGDLAADLAAGRPVPERLFPGERAVRALSAAARQAWSELGWQGVMMAGIAGLILAHRFLG